MSFSANSSTSTLAGETGAEMDGPQQLIAVYQSYRPEIEFLLQIALFAPLMTNTLKYTSPKVSRARQFPYPQMMVHILTGPLQLLRYYSRYMATHSLPVPDATDLVLFSLFNTSSLLLEFYRSKGQSAIFRAGFQAPIIMLCCLAPLACSWKDPVLFRSSVLSISWFAWFRWTARVISIVKPDLSYVPKSEWTIMLSACLALWYSEYPAGVPIFLGFVASLLWVERALAVKVSKYSEDNLFRKLVVTTGFVDFGVLKELTSTSDDSKPSESEKEVRIDDKPAENCGSVPTMFMI